jgi:hypothetical protein
MHEPQKMVAWYSPPRLVSTGIRVAISTVFGEFADRREIQSIGRQHEMALDQAYDYSEAPDGPFWFDYVADCGDGWNSTYAIARLLAQRELRPRGCDEALPRGRFLVMGGDMVYPTPSRRNYEMRLLRPYDAAAGAADWPEGEEADLYAVPGNHDWYDGLSAFMGIFAARRPHARGQGDQGRRFGRRFARQTRSYFALRLPHNYWLWGADVQLAGYIDQPQLAFFERVAANWMNANGRVILCIAEPRWAYVTEDADPTERDRFKNFALLEHLVTAAGRGHQVALVMAGDSHHYARHVEEGRNYVISGGGGAFLHPTHNVRDRLGVPSDLPPPGRQREAGQRYERNFRVAQDPKTGKESLFPDRTTSRSIGWRNFGFAIMNWHFTLTLLALFLLFNWLMLVNGRIAGTPLADALLGPGAMVAYWRIAFATPWPSVAALAAFGGFYYLADYRHGLKRFALGAAHALAHYAVVILAAIPVAPAVSGMARPDLAFVLAASVIAAPLSATIFGIYLIASLELLGRHWNEAFSALRVEDHKNFLRLRIGVDGTLTVFPIGLNRVPADDAQSGPRNPPLEPHLIEGPLPVYPPQP